MSKTRKELAIAVLEELFVLEGGETPAAEEIAPISRKIDEIMPELEQGGLVTDWRGDAIDEKFMDPLAKFVAARVCRKYVTDREVQSYEALEPRALRLIHRLSAEPYKERPVKASYF